MRFVTMMLCSLIVALISGIVTEDFGQRLVICGLGGLAIGIVFAQPPEE